MYIMNILASLEFMFVIVAVIAIVILHLVGGCCDKYKLVQITIFGRQINLTVLILMAVIYGLIVVSTLGGCCNEGFTNLIKDNLASAAAPALSHNDKIPSMFTTKFDPKCCPNTYSNSSGCYCG